MNILFLTQIVPYPPDAGPKVKTYHVIRALAGQGHSVTLVSFVRPEEVPHLPALKEICTAVHAVPIRRSRIADAFYMLRSYLTGRPFLVERDDLRPMQETVNRLVRENDFHFIHADQLTMVQFAVRGAAAVSGKQPKVIFDAHNAVWTIVARMKDNARWFLKPVLSVEAARVKRYEGGLLRTVDHVLAVTDIDRSLLEEAMHVSNHHADRPAAPITVIPIAVDTEKLQPVRRKPGSKNIVTLGTLHYPPNADGIRWFFNEVFPLVRERAPDATLTIIGKNPPADFSEAAERSAGAIRVTGYVDDLRPYLEESALMVVPVRAGGGMRVRILEAFAYAMPVVTTTVGLEGIHATPDQDVLVADTPAEFASRTVELLHDFSLQDKLAANGRTLATTKYDWQAVLSAMRPIYEQA
ncbi:MAG: glycosyltransferase family 4 protein [Anaerolineales bacterium]|nr:glycosyltransferase family 4 protein [Anaerolineales bacterium]NUQ83842.1 glycosyltransferase [Anaerolineales bacterium]